MKTYETYKNSGVDWIGEIPVDWNISQYKFVAEVQNGFAFKSSLFDKSDGFPILRIRDITSGRISTFYQGEFSNDYVVRQNDLLIGMDGDFNVRWWDNEDVLLNQRCCRLINKENADKRFLYYIIPINLQIINDLTYYTTVKHLSSGDINNAKLSLPPLKEQTQIANYLDHKTQIIDALIEKKEQLIKKLQAQRQAIINEAVTKGLNPNAPMKDSGIEWLGEIPEHWDLIPIRYLNTKTGSGVTPRGGGEAYSDEGIDFIRSQNVYFDGLRLDNIVKISDLVHQKMSNSKVYFNDVLLNITGASIGRSCVVEIKEEMNVNQHVCIIRANESILPKYLNFVLHSEVGQTQIKLGITGGNREGLSLEAIKDFIIPMPSVEEQKNIITKIDKSSRHTEKLIGLVNSQIKKLKSYRQSIISEAVTGKIDVRDWQAPSKN